AGIVPLEQGSDRELAHHIPELAASNTRRLAIAHPRDRLAALVQRGREDGRCALVFTVALAADAELDNHRIRFAADVLRELNHRTDIGLAEIGDVEPM